VECLATPTHPVLGPVTWPSTKSGKQVIPLRTDVAFGDRAQAPCIGSVLLGRTVPLSAIRGNGSQSLFVVGPSRSAEKGDPRYPSAGHQMDHQVRRRWRDSGNKIISTAHSSVHSRLPSASPPPPAELGGSLYSMHLSSVHCSCVSSDPAHRGFLACPVARPPSRSSKEEIIPALGRGDADTRMLSLADACLRDSAVRAYALTDVT
jgi:hypothetical protein